MTDQDTGAVEQELQEAQESSGTTQPQYEIPEKFRDKSVEDVVKSYSELEKQFGRQAQELGDVRKLAEQMIQRELKVNSQNESKPVVEEEFEFDYDNPKESIKKLLEQEIKPLKDNLAKTEGYITVKQLEAAHPDYKEVGSSSEFQEWVNSSNVRQDLYHKADRLGDIESAMELLGTFKALNPPKTETPARNKSKEVESRVNEMATETGSTGQSQGKVWKRSDIVNLRAYEPRKYEQLKGEIYQAYQEGRVK